MVRGRLIDTNQQSLRDWRNLVQFSLQSPEGPPQMLHGPVLVTLGFYLARPKAHFGVGRNAGKLKPSAPEMPIGKPDLDKLVRAVFDALTGMVFRDDSQVAVLVATKQYADDERGPGVSIRVGTGA